MVLVVIFQFKDDENDKVTQENTLTNANIIEFGKGINESCNRYVRKRFIDNFGGYRTHYMEDYDLWLRVINEKVEIT